MRRRHGIGLGLVGVLLGVAAETPTRPKSPKATDALRVEAAAVRKATANYWEAIATADRRLEVELNTAAKLAHARDDGAEEQACLDAARDAQQRYLTGAGSPDAAPPRPFRFEGRK